MKQVPVAISKVVELDIVQTEGVIDVKLTGKAELVVAVNATFGSESSER